MTRALVDFGKLRIRSITTADGQRLLAHTDVCRALGLRNTTTALYRLPHSDKVNWREASGAPGTAKWLITEEGFWRLVAAQRGKPGEALRDWLVGEVLPALAMHGRYELPRQATAPKAALEATAQLGRLRAALAKAAQELDALTTADAT